MVEVGSCKYKLSKPLLQTTIRFVKLKIQRFSYISKIPSLLVDVAKNATKLMYTFCKIFLLLKKQLVKKVKFL